MLIAEPPHPTQCYTIPYRTKLSLRLAFPDQDTLYVTLSSSLSSTIICHPYTGFSQNLLLLKLLFSSIFMIPSPRAPIRPRENIVVTKTE